MTSNLYEAFRQQFISRRGGSLLHPLEQKVFEFAEKYQLFQQGDHLTVAFSGGADSVSLLALLAQWRPYFGYQLSAAHLNHLLRGKESWRDEEFCVAFCAHREIPLEIRRLPIASLAKEQGLSVELCARRERYAFFREVAPGAVLTAHTLSDSAETTLYHLTRGTGMEGLIGIPAHRQEIWRPLIRVTREEVEDYCRYQGLAYVTDSTNLERVYTRNKIRWEVLPRLREINPQVVPAIGRMQDALTVDSQYLEQQAQRAFEELSTPRGLERQAYLDLHPAIGRRVLMRLLEAYEMPVSTQRVENLHADIEGRSAVSATPYHLEFFREDDFFGFREREEFLHPFSVAFTLEEWPVDQRVEVLPGKSLRIVSEDCKECENIANSLPKEYNITLDYDKMKASLIVHQPQPTITFRPAQRYAWQGEPLEKVHVSHRYSLSDLYRRKAVSPRERQRLFVLSQGQQVLWIEGFGVDQQVAVDSGTTRVVRLQIKRED